MISLISKLLDYKLERQEVVRSKSWIWLAEFVDDRRNGVGFLHHATAPRERLKEPPHLWQPRRPDGENLEHWVGVVERQEVREWMKEGKPEAEERQKRE